jgi:hypothetical protein
MFLVVIPGINTMHLQRQALLGVPGGQGCCRQPPTMQALLLQPVAAA